MTVFRVERRTRGAQLPPKGVAPELACRRHRLAGGVRVGGATGVRASPRLVAPMPSRGRSSEVDGTRTFHVDPAAWGRGLPRDGGHQAIAWPELRGGWHSDVPRGSGGVGARASPRWVAPKPS